MPLGSTRLPLSVLFMRNMQPDSGLKTTSRLLMWLEYDLLDRHIAINGFPEKLPKGMMHLFKCAWGWLCFLTRLSVVSCLGSLWRVSCTLTLRQSSLRSPHTIFTSTHHLDKLLCKAKRRFVSFSAFRKLKNDSFPCMAWSFHDLISWCLRFS